MKKIIATPLKCVDNVRFGMKREEVRNRFGKFSEFRKSQFSSNTTDDFGWCHVYYDKDDRCEAIEIFDGEVFVDDVKVFPVDPSELDKVFDDIAEDDEGYLSEKYSVGVYSPDDTMEGILFGAKGYYN